MGPILGIVTFFVVLVLLMLKQINQYERGVMFTLGRFTGIKEPGWRIVVPVFQSLTKVDIRTKAVDVPDQEAITKDNIPVKINAVVYYKIQDASKAILEVENFFWATSQVAQTTMRNAVGEVTLDELLQNRAGIAEKIKATVDRQTDPWGIDVESLELKDVIIPENLKRTISKEAEAEREKRAVIITAEGEKMAAKNITEAAQMLATAPGALHLRTLQAINDLSSDQSNTTIWMVPVEGFAALRGIADKLGVKSSDTKDI
ncbi:slipin family protein [bacterium]|nr:slipin family protein [bacterium]NCQ54773.1 slipin family protein [Candidatus Parcubacteria bacterium]NCS68026.1 slipin family protein [Candidatus Peregrinibacteria bacterium]NCS95763.1 slipin family protein [bacterium]